MFCFLASLMIEQWTGDLHIFIGEVSLIFIESLSFVLKSKLVYLFIFFVAHSQTKNLYDLLSEYSFVVQHKLCKLVDLWVHFKSFKMMANYEISDQTEQDRVLVFLNEAQTSFWT